MSLHCRQICRPEATAAALLGLQKCPGQYIELP